MNGTITLPPNVEAVISFGGGIVARYKTCPFCAGEMHRYPRPAHPHGHRLYGRCLGCNAGWWEHEEHGRIMDSMAVEEDRLVAA